MGFLVALALIAGIWWFGKRRAAVPVLSVAEARDLLGLSSNAGVEEVRAAHRRLMARVHPDAGGSAALARRVNAARDLLVTELNGTRA